MEIEQLAKSVDCGKTRGTIDSSRRQMEVDLSGRPYGGVETPHTKVSPRNIGVPDHVQPAHNTKSAPTVNSTQDDIRTVRRFLEKEESLR